MTRLRVALAVAAALLAGAPAAAQQPSFTDFDVSLPARVGAYERIGLTREQDSYAARYQAADGRYVDAIFYPFAVEAQCGAACDSLAVHGEADAFAGLIPELIARGYYQRLAVAADARIRREGGAMRWSGRHLVLRGAREGADVTSQLYLMSQGVHLLKLRATYAPDTAEDARVEAFSADLVREMGRLNAGCADREWSGDAYALSGEADGPPEAVAERVAAFLTRLGFTVLPVGDPRVVLTAPVWGRASDGETAGDGFDPGMRVAVMVTEANGRATVQIGATPVCVVPGVDEARHTAGALVLAAQLQSVLAGGETPE